MNGSEQRAIGWLQPEWKIDENTITSNGRTGFGRPVDGMFANQDPIVDVSADSPAVAVGEEEAVNRRDYFAAFGPLSNESQSMVLLWPDSKRRSPSMNPGPIRCAPMVVTQWLWRLLTLWLLLLLAISTGQLTGCKAEDRQE